MERVERGIVVRRRGVHGMFFDVLVGKVSWEGRVRIETVRNWKAVMRVPVPVCEDMRDSSV